MSFPAGMEFFRFVFSGGCNWLTAYCVYYRRSRHLFSIPFPKGISFLVSILFPPIDLIPNPRGLLVILVIDGFLKQAF